MSSRCTSSPIGKIRIFLFLPLPSKLAPKKNDHLTVTTTRQIISWLNNIYFALNYLYIFRGYRSIEKERGFYYGISRQKHGPYDPNYCAPDHEPVQMTSENNLFVMKRFASMKIIFYQKMYRTCAIITRSWLLTIFT